jgi:hypothetical protein
MSKLERDLSDKDLKLRTNELRDFYGSFMVRHNLIKKRGSLAARKNTLLNPSETLLEPFIQGTQRLIWKLSNNCKRQ